MPSDDFDPSTFSKPTGEAAVGTVGEEHARFSLIELGIYLALLTAMSFLTCSMTARGYWRAETNLIVVLLVAFAKASLVVGYFMQLRYERGWKYALAIPPLLLATALVVAVLPDVGFETFLKLDDWKQQTTP